MARIVALEDRHTAAAARGGQCVSDRYVNARLPLKWRCSKSHVWHAPWYSIQQGTWCRTCSHQQRGAALLGDNIRQARQLAAKRQGKCLTTENLPVALLYSWECRLGHRWSARLSNVRSAKTWCPTCAGNKPLGLDCAKAHAQAHGGECLEVVYINNNTPVLWRCSEGHEWRALLSNVRQNGSWCARCAGTAKHTLEYVQQIASVRGGSCLSVEYVNLDALMSWRCAEGHVWETSFDNILRGETWCPCCSYRSEKECRALFETLLGRVFIKCRPKWLEGLELDGYCEELRLAFEYQGAQHYHRRGEQDLKTQQERDRRKAELCDDNLVTLVVVPYWVRDMRTFVDLKLRELGYTIIAPRGEEVLAESKGITPSLRLTAADIDELLSGIAETPSTLTDEEIEDLLR